MRVMLFFELARKTFGYVNLNVAAERWLSRQGIASDETNPLLDPVVCGQMVDELHETLGIDYSFGGWLEDRRSLWRGSYLDTKGTHVHLGVDFNVPAGTSVAAEQAGRVVRIDCDVPEEGGWGTRVIFRPAVGDEVLVYAHLDRAVGCRVGDALRPGDVFAKVGAAPFNGGWFSHLHVQCVQRDAFDRFERDGLKDMDGYGAADDLSALGRTFKDPLRLVWR